MESLAPAGQPAALPWPVSAMLLGSTSIVVGILWDISWHITIGRDTFWTPAHMAVYLGGVLAGICGGWLALKTTLAGTPGEWGRGRALLGVPRPARRLCGDLGRARHAHLGSLRRLVAQRVRPGR